MVVNISNCFQVVDCAIRNCAMLLSPDCFNIAKCLDQHVQLSSENMTILSIHIVVNLLFVVAVLMCNG